MPNPQPESPPGSEARGRTPLTADLTVLWVCGARIAGGAERATVEVARRLRERGHRLTVLHPPGSALEAALADAGLHGRGVGLGGVFRGYGLRSIRRALAAHAPDIVFVTTIDQWIPACLAAPGGRVVLVRHMALPVSPPVAWAAARAGAVVAVSGAVRDCLLRSGLSADRIRVISNPTRFPVRSTVPTAAERVAARGRLGLPANGRWVGFFGGLNAAKGITDMLAAARAGAQLGDLHLLICGRPGTARDRTAAATALRHAGLGDRCRDLGEIGAVDVALTAVDLVAVPTRRALGEAMPLTVIEAMACGTPVVASAVGGIPETLGDDGSSGRLVAPDDPEGLARALIDLLAAPERAGAMAARALQRARERFDPERIAEEYDALFRATRAAAR